MKRPYVMDTEVYANYLLIGFLDLQSGRVFSVEAIDANSRLSKDDRLWLRQKMRKGQVIGFNSAGFDLPVIYAAIQGLSVAEIKNLADDIIVGGMRSWEAEDEYGFEIPRDIDHIDLIEVAPGKASLKIYNGRLHGRRMQDLPIEPSKHLTEEEIEEVYTYWKNDLQATKLLYESLKVQLDLRAAMSKEYGIDLRSKSDAQLAEAVIKKQISKILGYMPKKPEIRGGTKFRYRAPDFIRFHGEQLNGILDDIEDWEFRVAATGKVLMPDFLSEARIEIGTSIYRMGIGGLHSSEECASHVADENTLLFEVDVASYYPRIILNLGLYPKQLGKAFLKVYRSIVDRRLKAKDRAKALRAEIDELKKQLSGRNSNGGPSLMQERIEELEAEWHKENVANEGGKIMINGSFGKLGSVFSALFAPDLLITVTLTGQLSLLMLIQRLVRAGIPVVSGNTDGIVIKCPKTRLSDMKAIIKCWQKETGFETDAAEYEALYSASVNNYLAIKKGGGVKRKGHYAKSGLEEKKNPTNDICAEAVAAHLEKGTSITETIRSCRDIRKFLTVRNVTGGAIYGVKEVAYERYGKRGQRLKDGAKFDACEAEYLGKAVRFYRSTNSLGALHYQSNHNKVPKSDYCRPLMELPDSFPSDVDFSAYVREARQMLLDIAYEADLAGKPSPRKRKEAA